MVHDWAQYSDRQEEQGSDNNNGPEQEYAKGGSVRYGESPDQTGSISSLQDMLPWRSAQ